MGLDMYLEKKTYVKNWDHMKDEEKTEVTIKKGGKEMTQIRTERISEITEEIAVWRKSNAIHKWFVDNVQEGEDDCKSYYVGKDQLKELLNEVKLVLLDKDSADDILPTQKGFFFGGNEYDDYYFEDMEYTKEILEKVMNESEGDFYYSSSW